LFTAAAVRALDRTAIEIAGIPGLELMRRAGLAAYRLLRRRWPEAARLAIVCGPGNNGGDGWVVAELAQRDGLRPTVIAVGDQLALGPDAAAARAAALAAGVPVASDGAVVTHGQVVVDALFGIGLTREISGEFRAAIDAINAASAAGRPVLALDIPSGLHADTGMVLGAAVRADSTITFIGLKRGLVTGVAAEYTGRLAFDALGTPPSIFDAVPACARRVRFAALKQCLPPRARAAHKGDHGHVLIVGGAPGYAGAARMAAEAALRVGAGLVSTAVHPACAAQLNSGRPEIMVHAVSDAAALAPLLRRASVVAIGPGLAQLDWSAELFAAVRDAPLPLVLDADALNLLARDPQRRDDWCLTPHPGEAARLLDVSTRDIANDRYAAAAALNARYGGVVVLKGAGSLVSSADGGIDVIADGNPGMASGGMGDVLTGIIAALRAQGLALCEAASLGTALHAAAADAAALDGERGLLASDLFGQLRRLVN
jgi:ADP-dependent NAD(P)H-hydrate dehydratase / NAD(P)H-hydrate epimerase